MAVVRGPKPFEACDVLASAQPEDHRWAIVLAGGEGTRLNGVTTQRYGVHRPKQYCAFWGGRSMLQWTLDRTIPLVASAQTKTVIGNGHESMFARAVSNPGAGEVIVQPDNCGTLPGILLPLSHVLAEDPEAIVLLLPSDHFILPTQIFVDRAHRAMELAARYPEKLVLLGAVPDAPVHDYGWVQPSEATCGIDDWDARSVSAFIEKPDQVTAKRLYGRGWLWNTMMVAAKAKTMWNAAFVCAEELLHRFNAYRQAVTAVRTGRAPIGHAESALAHLYRDMSSADFSRDLLQRVPQRCTVLPLKDVYWCDCGHPDRLALLLTKYSEWDEAYDDVRVAVGPPQPRRANAVPN